jgi:iron complex outermembrane receptor protein
LKKKSHIGLLSTSAILSVAVCSSLPAWAQSEATSEAQSPEAPKATGTVTAEELLKEIVVTAAKERQVAGGLMIVQRQPETTNSITAEAISEKIGIAGPFQLVASLPGVNAGFSDPYQLSIRYNLFIRGLPATKLGFVYDGVPGMDRAYHLPYTEENIDNENIAGLTIHPGSARITDPVQTAVGGEFSISVRDPSDEAGGQTSYSYGSFHGRRAFAGFDTGELGSTGLKAFSTFSYSEGGNFSSPEDALTNRFHTDTKLAKDWGDIGKSTLWVSYNETTALRSLALTRAQYDTASQTGNFAAFDYKPTWDPTSNSNNYWKHGIYTRKNVLVAWNNDITASDKLRLKVTPYYQWIISNGEAPSSLDPSSFYYGTQRVTVSSAGLFLLPNGNIPVVSNILQNEHVYGVNSVATYDLAPSNSLQAGWWYDHFKMSDINGFSPVSAGGDAPEWGGDPLVSTAGQVISSANFTLGTDINAFSIQDMQSFLDDKLKLEVGLRYFMYEMSGDNLLPGPQSAMNFKFQKLLPRATLSYDINDAMQVYGNIVTDVRTNTPIQTYPNTYNVATGTISQVGNLDPRPETSLGEELGFRYHDHLVTADVALFNKKINNNSLGGVQSFLNGAAVNQTINLGGQKMHGLTAELAPAPIHGFSPYVNGQYLWTEMTDNFQVLTTTNTIDYLPTKGKEAVQAPKYTAAAGVSYNNGPLFGNLLYKYIGSQWGTFINDEKMPGFSQVDLNVGYRLPEGSFGKEPVIKLSITNIGNKVNLSWFAANQPNAKTTTGINGGTVAGKAVTYFVNSPRAIMATISTKF